MGKRGGGNGKKNAKNLLRNDLARDHQQPSDCSTDDDVSEEQACVSTSSIDIQQIVSTAIKHIISEIKSELYAAVHSFQKDVTSRFESIEQIISASDKKFDSMNKTVTMLDKNISDLKAQISRMPEKMSDFSISPTFVPTANPSPSVPQKLCARLNSQVKLSGAAPPALISTNDLQDVLEEMKERDKKKDNVVLVNVKEKEKGQCCAR